MRSLTPAERARRAAVLGITLPDPPAPTSPPAPAPRPNGKARSPIAGKLTASPALRAKLGLTVAEPPPQSEPEPVASPAPSAAPPSAGPSKRERKRALRREQYERARAPLMGHWPTIFTAARPLAIGIDKQVRSILRGQPPICGSSSRSGHVATPTAPLSRAAGRRVNLDGSDAGPAFDAPQDGRPGSG